jgi:methylglyoxal synthase
MSGNPTQQVKDTVYAATSTTGEWAQQNVVNPIKSYVSGEKGNDAERIEPNIPDEESEKIDRLEKEKIAEFLQERHKSNAPTKRR